MENDYRDDSQKHSDAKGRKEYDEQGQNAEEIRKDHTKELSEKGTADACQKEADACKATDLSKEGGISEDKSSWKEEADPVSRRVASVYYTPPYYVPNFKASDRNASSVGGAEKPKKTKKREASSLVIVLCALLSLLIAFGTGGLAGYFGASVANSRLSLDDSNTAMLKQSNGSILIKEALESEADAYTEVYSVVSAVADSVVEITTSQVKTDPFYGQYVTSGAGSGVIVAQTSTTGIIVTNFHVIADASDVVVRLTDGTEYTATYRGGDEAMDIAVLYISIEEGTLLQCATLGDSTQLAVGQRVVAIGNPLGSLGGTVTDGIISALDRKISVGDHVMTLLQTNAAINPGNSGGGLFDMAGRLVGMVNAKQSAEGIEGLGFAIPIHVVKDAIVSITESGYVKNRPTLGVEATYYEQDRMRAAGVYVTQCIHTDTPLQVNDRILSINGMTIESMLAYRAMVGSLTVGSEVEVIVQRGYRRETVTVTVMENTQNR